MKTMNLIHRKPKAKINKNASSESEEETESESSSSDSSEESGSSSSSSESSGSTSESEEVADTAKARHKIKKTVIRCDDLSVPAAPSSVVTPTQALVVSLQRTTPGSALFRPNGVVQTILKPQFSSTHSGSNTPSLLDETEEPSTLVKATPRAGRRRRRRALTICLSHCRYDIVRKTSEKYGLLEVSEDQPWNLYWTDYSVSLERAVEMRRFQIVNHFPGMNEICRKDLLARNLNRMRRNFPREYDIYPMSWCLPADGNELASYSATRKGRTYICKPEMGCQGRGIFLVKNVRDLNPFGRIICQLYVQKPFLIDFLKFDLRIYVLITSCDPLRIWVFKEGLARFATAKYRQPSSNNTENSYMHLTNYAVNKFSRDYIMDSEETGSKRKLSTVYQWLQDRDYDVVKLKGEIDDIIIKTILSAQPILKHHYRTCFPHHDICSACFELLGFDILLDHKLKPYIIEVNHSPSFHMDTNLDRHIKEELLRDTFSMLNVKQLERRKIENEDRKRVQQRLSRKVTEMKGKNSQNIKGAGDAPSGEKLGRHSNNNDNNNNASTENESKPPNTFKLSPEDAQFKWELDNCGGYRLIFPLPDSEKYDRFLDQNICSIYQETAASQARAHMTRTQIDEYNQKKLLDEKKRPLNQIKEVKGERESNRPLTRPLTQAGPGELPRSKGPPGVRRDSLRSAMPIDNRVRIAHSSFSSLSIDFGIGSKTPSGLPIITKEEYDRAKGLMQRGMLIRSLGIEMQVYNLLSQVGSLKPLEHEEFRRKHGFAIGSNAVQRMTTALNHQIRPSVPKFFAP